MTDTHQSSLPRRKFLAALGSVTVGAVATSAVGGPRPVSAVGAAATDHPIVLVHGAWHGGWCWDRVAPLLRATARPVHVATLTGLGERVHLARSVTGLSTHIDDVVNLITWEELKDVVLVGHSYGGLVITGVADRVPDRLAHLVFVDAAVPISGEAFQDFHPPEFAAKNRAAAEASGGVAIPPLAAKDFGITEPRDLDWVDRRLTPHPLLTYVDPLALRNPARNAISSTYIDCFQPPLASLNTSKARVQAQAGWTYQRLETGHDCMVTAPSMLAQLLQAVI